MSRPRHAIVFLACLLVGGTFVLAGVLKSLDVEGFARDIALHKIVGPGISAVLARILVPVEIVAGAAAIIGYRRRLALSVLAAALLVFIGATGYAWSQGNTEGCGCFGRYAARTPGQVILEDILLLGACALAFVLARPPESRNLKDGSPPSMTTPHSRWRPILLAVLAVVSTVFTLASPSLPIDDLATALRPGVTLHDLGLDSIAGNLAEGDRLLVILVLDQPSSAQTIPALNALGLKAGIPPITALTSSDEEKRAAFFWTHAPAFDLLEVPAADLKRLYRRAPRTFRVHNGVVLQVWNGIPPAEVFNR